MKNIPSFLALAAASLCLTGPAAHAQTAAPATGEVADTVAPDRPDFTDGPFIVPMGHVQLEGGASYGRTGGARDVSLGELLVRVPAGRKLEVRVGVPSYLRQRGGGASASGLDDATLGAKLAISGGGKGRPATALLVNVGLPTGSRRVAEHEYQPEVKLSAAWDLSEKVGLGVNLGYGQPTDGGQRFSQAFATASLGIQLTEKLGSFLEVYGFNHGDSTGQSARYFDGGFSYLVNPQLSLDARVGFGLGNNVGGPDYSYGFGATRLF